MVDYLSNLSEFTQVMLFTAFIIAGFLVAVYIRNKSYKDYVKRNGLKSEKPIHSRHVRMTLNGQPVKGVKTKSIQPSDEWDGFGDRYKNPKPMNTNNQNDHFFSGGGGRVDHSPTNDYCSGGGSSSSYDSGGSSCGGGD